MTDTTIDTTTPYDQTRENAIHRGYDAGNYANAYVSEDLDTAVEAAEEEHEDDPEHSGNVAHPQHAAWRDAFVLGFFGTYEDHEIGDLERVYEARASVGPRSAADARGVVATSSSAFGMTA